MSDNLSGMPLAMSCVGAAAGCDLLTPGVSEDAEDQKIAACGSSYKKRIVLAREADGLVLRTYPDHDWSTTARSIRR
ncbi:hypothetical protein [Pseudomonas putida]|uniref:hypothetical protein n=1 Tax=Pseudomonas putida TaxID=303 RepID=UPI003D97E5A6